MIYTPLSLAEQFLLMMPLGLVKNLYHQIETIIEKQKIHIDLETYQKPSFIKTLLEQKK